MNKTKKDLIRIIKDKKFDTWDKVKKYINKYKKYDNLTYRDIDEVFKSAINKITSQKG